MSGRRWAWTQQVGPDVILDRPVFDAIVGRMRVEAASDAKRKGVILSSEPVLTVAFQRTEWVDGEPSFWPVETAGDATEAWVRLVWDAADA